MSMKPERKYGLDLLRLAAMYLVVILHVLGHGGGLAEAGSNYYITWFFEASAYWAVDCFMLISGYVGFLSNNKLRNERKAVKLWLTVFSYSVLIAILFKIIKPGSMSTQSLLQSFAPVAFGKYWYVSSWIPTLILAPYLNRLIQNISVSETKEWIVKLIGVFSVYYLAAYADPFKFQNGYSFSWFIILYLVGAGIGKSGLLDRIKRKHCLIVFCACVIVTWAWKVFSPIYTKLFLSYTSPTVLIAAICMLCLFRNIEVKGACLKWTQFFYPAAFGVYLIHDNPTVRNQLIKQNFGWIAKLPIAAVIVVIPAVSFAIFALCLCIEKARLAIIEKLKINEKVDGVIDFFIRRTARLGKDDSEE